VGSSLALIGFYLGVMSLTGGWAYAQFQLQEYRWWILPLSIGFGTQVFLFLHVRRGLKAGQKRPAGAALAASGGVSATSMLACCLHHAADVIPFLGFSTLAVTVQRYQPLFFALGILSNLVGILVMFRMMIRNGLFPQSPILDRIGALLVFGNLQRRS
jgi:hypothetical protein